jgi:fatty acid desaturase
MGSAPDLDDSPANAALKTKRPISNERESVMGTKVGGILGLLILVADIWAVINIAQSPVSAGAKALWILVVLLLPVLGLIIWFVAGPQGAKA